MIRIWDIKDQEKIVSDIIRFNFNSFDKKDVDLDKDYLLLFDGIHARLLHLFSQNKSIDEITKDRTIIKFIWRQFSHWKYNLKKVRSTLNNKKMFEEELEAIFKYIKNNIDEYNEDVKMYQNRYKRKSSAVRQFLYPSRYIPDTRFNRYDHWWGDYA